jgi:hypothetical protein
MKDKNFGSQPSGFHTVRNETQAALLTNSDAWYFLEPFLARSISAKEASQEIGCNLDTLLYRIRVFQKAGLLKISEERKRAGRAIKLYRTVFDAYFVPHTLTPFATLEEHFQALFMPTIQEHIHNLAKRTQKRGTKGQNIYRDEFGKTWREGAFDSTTFDNLDEPSGASGFDFSLVSYLEETEARLVQTLLIQLLEAQRAKSQPSAGHKYLLSVYFTRSEL